MSTCVKCGQELPDSAAHCVFCGARQVAAAPAAGQAGPAAAPSWPPPSLPSDDDVAGAKTIGVSGDLVRQALDNLPEPPPAAPPLGLPPAVAPRVGSPGPFEAPPARGAVRNGPPGGFGGPAPGGFGGPTPGGFGAPPPAGFGAPPAAPGVGFGAPPAAPGVGFGAPPPAAPGGFGGPAPAGFGAPPPAAPGGFGGPAPAGFGAPPPAWGGAAPFGGAPASPFEAPVYNTPRPAGFGPPAADAAENATMIAQPRGTPPAGPAGSQTMLAPQGLSFGAPPPVGGPPPMGVPFGGPPLMGGPVAGGAATVLLPPGGGSVPSGPSTVAISPYSQQHTPPPYLASQTLERMGAPQEPWAHLLGTLLLVLGIGLIACFVLPWQIGEEVMFSWSAIADSPGAQKLTPLFIGITGVCGVVLGLIPLATVVRGIAAAALGALPMMVSALVINGFSVAGLFGFLGVLALVSGLLLRSEYQAALLPRVLTTVGVVLFLLTLLVPSDGQVPLVAHVKAVGSLPGRMKIVAILQLVWDVVPLFGLLCWWPPPGAAGTKILAWVVITQPVVQSLIVNLVTPHAEGLGTAIQSGIFTWFLGPLAVMAWLCLLGYGIATVLGKQLEHH